MARNIPVDDSKIKDVLLLFGYNDEEHKQIHSLAIELWKLVNRDKGSYSLLLTKIRALKMNPDFGELEAPLKFTKIFTLFSSSAKGLLAKIDSPPKVTSTDEEIQKFLADLDVATSAVSEASH